MRVKIAPSILAADLACLKDEVERAVEGGCDAFHIDIMDWHFVPNLSFGPSMVETVRRLTDLPLDVHLMTDNPLEMLRPFAEAGSDFITVHVEVLDDVPSALDEIRGLGARPGMTLKPDTPVEAVIPHVPLVELLLVMSVHPGFGGQKFIEESYGRIRRIAEAARSGNPEMVLSVDGGVNVENAASLVEAGVNYLVAGTAVFGNHGARENVALLRKAAEKGFGR